MKAAFLVATYKRAVLVKGCLKHLAASHIPDGWSLEIVVAAVEGDPGIPVVEAFAAKSQVPVRLAIGKNRAVGRQFQRALEATDADLVMETGDDALQSADRLTHAAAAHEAGAIISGSGSFWFYEWKSGRAAYWTGPPLRAGVVLNFKAELIRAVGGWDSVMSNNDFMLQKKIRKHLGHEPEAAVLSDELGRDTVSIHTAASMSAVRPFGGENRVFSHGSFIIETVGDAEKAAGFPQSALDTLRAMRAS